MPNPNGTRTRDEHRQAILALAEKHVEQGKSPDDAITAAGAEWRERLRAEGDEKIAGVLKFLGQR